MTKYKQQRDVLQ